MNGLENRLQKAREEMELAEQLERKLEAAKESMSQAKARVEELKKILQKEKRDVEKLEGLSLTGLFASLLGTKAEKMDKEKQEYLAAELKYETALDTVKALEKEINTFEGQLLPLAKAKDKYQALLSEKEELLKAQGGSVAKSLLALAEEEGRLKARGKELQEARDAAQKGLRALEDLRNSLDSAAGWGTWDMLGGGMISTALKHSKIDEAKGQAIKAQRYLEHLSRELAEVQLNSDLRIELDGLLTFADFFFDGLIVDWMVQSKINEAKDRVRRIMSRVESINQSLSQEMKKTAQRINQIRQERQAVLEQN